MSELAVTDVGGPGGDWPIKFIVPEHLTQIVKVVLTHSAVGAGAYMCKSPGPAPDAASRIDWYDFSAGATKFYEVKPGFSLRFGGGSKGDAGHPATAAVCRATLIELRDPLGVKVEVEVKVEVG